MFNVLFCLITLLFGRGLTIDIPVGFCYTEAIIRILTIGRSPIW